MALERYNPFDEFRDLERRVDELMRFPLMTLTRPLRSWRAPMADVCWMPSIEMCEKPDKFLVDVEVPGMKMEDIELSVVGDTLTIKGQRKSATDVKEEEYVRSEFCYGTFSRSLTLPAAVQADKVEATLENGILHISIPKAEAILPKKIPIKVKATSK